MDKKRRRELEQFKQVATRWPDAFPSLGNAEISQPAPPAADIEYRAKDGRVCAVEITALVRAEGMEIHRARDALVNDLRDMFSRRNSTLSASFGFSEGRLPAHQDAVHQLASCIDALATFDLPLRVARRDGFNDSRAARLPVFVSSVQLWHGLPSEAVRWNRGDVFSSLTITARRIQSCIDGKSSRLDGYRRTAAHVSLLMIAPRGVSQALCRLPADASAWTFAHPFDEVLLFVEDSQGGGLRF